jgi:hypothetical protein
VLCLGSILRVWVVPPDAHDHPAKGFGVPDRSDERMDRLLSANLNTSNHRRPSNLVCFGDGGGEDARLVHEQERSKLEVETVARLPLSSGSW